MLRKSQTNLRTPINFFSFQASMPKWNYEQVFAFANKAALKPCRLSLQQVSIFHNDWVVAPTDWLSTVVSP